MMSLPASLMPLTAADYWVGWRWARRANGKLTKPPVNVRGGPAESDNPKTWASFAAAVEAVEAGRAAGVGYVCLYDRERIFVDLDKCRDRETGAVADWAMRIVEAAGSYTEVTPSGTGLRIIGNRGHLTAPISRALKLGAEGHEVEVYYQATRYVTVTGDRLPGTPDQLADIADIALDLLVAGGKAAAAEEGGAHPFEPNAEQVAPLEDVEAALAAIGNPDLPYEEWVRIGMAAFAATGGSAFGRLAWVAWSRKSAKHDDDECTRVWRSFRAAPPTKIGFGTLYHMASAADAFWQPPSWAARRAEHTEREKSKAGSGENTAENPDPWADQPKRHSKLKGLTLSDLMNMPPPEYRIADLVTVGGFAGLYGPPGGYKSFVALGMALSIAFGLPWCGREVKRAAVLYVAGEGARGIGKRVRAWLRHHGLEDVPEAPFRLIDAGVNLTNPAEAAELILAATDLAEEEGQPVGAIFIDTVARAMVGADENSSKEMGAFNEQCARIIREARTGPEIGPTVVAVHHTGKDAGRGARGSNAFPGAVDTLLRVIRDEEDPGRLSIEVEKQKDGEAADTILLRALKISLGEGDDPLLSSLVIAEEDGTIDLGAEALKPRPKRRPLNNGAQVGLLALQWAIERTGTERRGLRDVPGSTKTVTRKEWRDAYLARSDAPTETAARVAFGRAVKDLDAAGVARMLGEYAWIVRDEHA